MLPRYVVARKRPNGTVYYWQVPPRLRVQKGNEVWPDGIIRLPDDPEKMLPAAAKLNRELDAMRRGTPSNGRRECPRNTSHHRTQDAFGGPEVHAVGHAKRVG